MKLWTILFVGLIGFNNAKSFPQEPKKVVVQNTMLDDLLPSCPNLDKIQGFAEQDVIKSCKDWPEIKKTTELTQDTANNVLCLVFFHNVKKFCSKTKNLKTMVLINDKDLKNMTSEGICAKQEIFEDVNLKNVKIDEATCTRLCTDFVGHVVALCSKAAYYRTLAMREKQVESPSKQETFALHKTVQDNQQTVQATVKTQPQSVVQVATEIPVQELQENKPLEPLKQEAKPKEEVPQNKPLVTPNAPPTEPKVEPPKSDIKIKTSPVPETQPDGLSAGVQGFPEEVADDEEGKVIQKIEPNEKEEEDDEEELPENEPKKKSKPNLVDPDEPANLQAASVVNLDGGDSYFLSYFMAISIFCVVGYVGYHNRQKIMALLLEGKRSRRPSRTGRRPNSANYHKLDSNLEEAISSSCNKSSSHVIY